MAGYTYTISNAGALKRWLKWAIYVYRGSKPSRNKGGHSPQAFRAYGHIAWIAHTQPFILDFSHGKCPRPENKKKVAWCIQTFFNDRQYRGTGEHYRA